MVTVVVTEVDMEADVIPVLVRCIRQLVMSVEILVRYLLDQVETNLFTAVAVLRLKAVEIQGILEDQEELAKENHEVAVDSKRKMTQTRNYLSKYHG